MGARGPGEPLRTLRSGRPGRSGRSRLAGRSGRANCSRRPLRSYRALESRESAQADRPLRALCAGRAIGTGATVETFRAARTRRACRALVTGGAVCAPLTWRPLHALWTGGAWEPCNPPRAHRAGRSLLAVPAVALRARSSGLLVRLHERQLSRRPLLSLRTACRRHRDAGEKEHRRRRDGGLDEPA